ncbi:hypothetical protein ACQP2U_42755 (plasmid) [Nocardia sp. CA-084685]|uniref:hypothetical protein n=1 Tax=Nocardia sp. CA-084685 TaxID=3239970 RepID=UPI003D983172
MAQNPTPSQKRVVSALAKAGRPLRAIDLPGGDDFRVRGGIVKTLKWMARNDFAVAVAADDARQTAYALTETGLQWRRETIGTQT